MTCGNGRLEGSEACDDRNLLDGDGVLQTELDETCDDGNTDGEDGCDSMCRHELI